MDEVRQKVTQIISQAFDYDGPLVDDMTTDDVDGWDSLGHVTVMLMVERALGIRFTEGERDNLANIGELFALSEKKVAYQKNSQSE